MSAHPHQETIDRAVELKHTGHNCCQAVAVAIAEKHPEYHLDIETLDQIGAGFGSGMGGMQGTCGALCGAVMAAGLATHGKNTKLVAKQMVERFKELTGATICGQIKGVGTGKMLCACDDCVRHGVMVASEYLGENF